MRFSSRLLANLKSARFLEPNAPTGLTGLHNHPAPRSALIYLYSSTLDKLKPFPESSAYRQSTEALTRHRLALVEAVKPPGYDEWQAHTKKLIDEHPNEFNAPEAGAKPAGAKHIRSIRDGRHFVTTKQVQQPDERLEEWDGEVIGPPELEGTRTAAERADQAALGQARPDNEGAEIKWEPEPPLEVGQITELESKIGAGLLEEVIQVAEGELRLVETMARHKVWDELVEKPADGQWSYFERGTHTGKTQEP